MKTIKDIVNIAYKDLLEFTRTKIRLVMMIIMPLFMMIMTGSIFPSQNTIKDIPIGLVVEQPSTVTNIITTTLDQFNSENHFFKIENVSSPDLAKKMINEGKIKGGIVIPGSITQLLSEQKQADIIVLQDDTNPQVSSILTSVLNQIIETASTKYAANTLSQLNKSISNPIALVRPLIVETQGSLEGSVNYFQFVAPGIMMMVVMTGIMTGIPRAISFEKESGTLDGLLVAPTSTLSIIIGKTSAQILRGLLQASIILILSVLVFDVIIKGSVFLVFFLLLLGVFSITGLGIALTSLASDQEAATMLISTIMFPMLFLSGVFFPIDQMPKLVQNISDILPLTYAINALRRAITLGASFGDLSHDILILSIFGTIMLFISVPLFKKMMTK